MAKRVLIAGFEPLAGEKVSPSEMVARAFEGKTLAGRTIAVRIIPVETRNIRERFERALNEDDPDLVIALAQFGGRNALSLERVAVNVLDFDRPDNVGVMRKGDVIARGGADARISTIPFEKIIEAWHANGVPGYVSNTAGTSIGNQTLYEILGLTESAAPPVIAGLVHLPYLPAQAIAAGSESTPSMSLELQRRGVEIMIETLVPWFERRTPDSKPSAMPGAPTKSTWIPRGVKEAER